MAAPASAAPPRPAAPPAAPAAGEPDEAAAPAPRGKKKLLFLGVGALLLLAGGGGAGWYFVLHRGQPPAEVKETAPKPPDHVLKIGTIVVNVARTEGRRFLRATVEVGASGKAAKHLEEMRAPLVDAAISVLGGKALEQILSTEERDHLREELRERLNAAAGGHGITHVFLTEFVVQ